MLQIPLDRGCQPCFEIDRGLPPEFIPQFAGVDGVTQIVTRPVGDKTDQPFMGRAFWEVSVHQVAYCPYHVDVLTLGFASDVISCTHAPFYQYFPQRPRMVFDIKPVANIAPLAVNR